MANPDPLNPGHIDGQNPATPERMPGSTAEVLSQTTSADIQGTPAFLFKAGGMGAVTQDASGANLPDSGEGPWVMEQYFTLGVRHVALGDINPEPVIRGIKAHGYYTWRLRRGDEGQSQ